MPTCIYCLNNKSSLDFTREHVIPGSFGRFRNNFTLIEKVCNECNQYFGNELELFLGRDTFEGMLRFVHGAKAPREFKAFNNKRIKFTLNEEGSWKGAIMELGYNVQQNKVVVNPLTQVGFQKKYIEQWEFFEVEDIKPKNELEDLGFSMGKEGVIKILCDNKEGQKEIEQKLIQKGIKLENETLLPFDYKNQKIEVEIHCTIDRIIWRGIAKIAFNYLAYVGGAFHINPFDDNFSGIRDFIRYGQSDNFAYVALQKFPVLEMDRRLNIKSTQGHLITFGWNGSHVTLVSQVTLFNTVTYRIVFCQKFIGLFRPVSSGHHFDIEHKEITRLIGIPRNFLV